MEFRITQIKEVIGVNLSFSPSVASDTRLHVEFKAYQHIGMNPYTLTAVLPSTGKFADLKIGEVWNFTAPEDVQTDTKTDEDPRFKMWHRAETKLNCTDSATRDHEYDGIEEAESANAGPEPWIDNKSWNPLRHTARDNEAHEAAEQTERLLATLDDDEDPSLRTYWERYW